MVEYLEKLLYDKTQNSQASILDAQWKYDKKIIPKALQAISNLFPHYSLHDESHSTTIINNIIRILGIENIQKLSSIDIWLILEASYVHDIGMVVTGKEIEKSLTEKGFLEFFKEILDDEKNPFHEFANRFKIKKDKILYKDNYVNIELHDGLKFILAEFFRRIHSKRSKDIIDNPQSLVLSSPRGAIPRRIFKILGEICEAHTKTFEQVMHLPFKQVGIDTEDAHPKFIACLLRLGDLLDIDNDRFSEVILQTLQKIPLDTITHKNKHLAIELLRIDRDIIEITAKCNNYEVSSITQRWFDYLDSEIRNQMIHWNNIVPYKGFCVLPTIGNLKIDLIGYDLIDGKNKPRFTLDSAKAAELLKGAGLYDGPYQSIREIIQNAVDATLLRIWLDYSEDIKFNTPHENSFLELLNKYPIKITIKQLDIKEEEKRWLFEVIDLGIGISTEDLKFLINTGSSSKNRSKMQIIESMPPWLKPSGIFGIGFQSIFLLTDVVNIATKSYISQEEQFFELNSPTAQKNGDILIKKKASTYVKKPGTQLSFIYKTPVLPKTYSVRLDSHAYKTLFDYDPIVHESLDIELAKILDEIYNIADKCYLPIELVVDEKEIILDQKTLQKFKFYDSENSLELNVECDDMKPNKLNIFYKNQKVSTNLRFMFLSLEINIHGDVASEVLTLNRNKIRSEYESKLHYQILQSVFKILNKDFESLFNKKQDMALASMFLYFYSDRYETLKKIIDLNRFDHWKKYNVQLENKNYDLEEILVCTKTTTLVYSNTRLNTKEGLALKDDDLEITLPARHANNDYMSFILFKLKETLKSFKSYEAHDGSEFLKFSKEIDEEATEVQIKRLLNKLIIRSPFYSSRIIVPCPQDYFNLRIIDNVFEFHLNQIPIDNNIPLALPKMLFPYVTELNYDGKCRTILSLNEKVYNWVYKYRFNKNTTLEDIKDAYSKFIMEFRLDKSINN